MGSDLDEHFDRLAWVRGEIEKLEQEVDDYLKSDPVELTWFLDLDRHQSKRIYKAKVRTPIPRGAQIRSGTIINEMRAVLDALTCTLALRNGARNVSSTYFPTGKTRAIFESADVQRKVRYLTAADRAVITALKPYPGGNDMLYALHSSDLVRKHQRLILFNATSGGTALGSDEGWVLRGSRVYEMHVGVRPIDETPFAILAWDYHIPIEIFPIVTFAEPDFIKSKPVVATLNDFAGLVESILKLFA